MWTCRSLVSHTSPAPATHITSSFALTFFHLSYTPIYIHTHPFNGHFSRTTRVSRYQKGKPIWILLKQQTASGSGISWAICKSAPRSRQITMPAPTTGHHSFFTGRMPFLPPNQQRQSTEGSSLTRLYNLYIIKHNPIFITIIISVTAILLRHACFCFIVNRSLST